MPSSPVAALLPFFQYRGLAPHTYYLRDEVLQHIPCVNWRETHWVW
jgi:hypothetical protein